jgi:hypothetical protein
MLELKYCGNNNRGSRNFMIQELLWMLLFLKESNRMAFKLGDFLTQISKN